MSSDTLAQLLHVDTAQWRAEMEHIGKYFEDFGDRLPSQLSAEHEKVLRALS